jgi:hypothetical protein
LARGNLRQHRRRGAAFRFQSAPGPLARGNTKTFTLQGGVNFVSIRPRPVGQGKRLSLQLAS